MEWRCTFISISHKSLLEMVQANRVKNLSICSRVSLGVSLMGAARSAFKRLTAMSILIWSPLNLGSQAREPDSQYRLAGRNEKIVSSQTFRIGGATIQVDFASGNLDVD
jgi:hypothetical protein